MKGSHPKGRLPFFHSYWRRKMEDTKHKSAQVQYKAASEDGIVEAIVSVFGNVDSYGEVVMPGAFAKSLSQKLPKGVWAHDWASPIATTLEATEVMPYDPRLPDGLKELGGLLIKAQFYKDIQDSWDAYLKIKNGMYDEFSIGFTVKNYNIVENIVQLTEIELYEWSPVLIGANRMTAVLSVKSALPFSEDLLGMKQDLQRFADRVKDRKEFREKAGRVFSSANVDALTGIAETLDAISESTKGEAVAIREMIASATQPKAAATELQLLKLQLKHKGLL